MLEHVHVLELVAAQHWGFKRFEVANLQHDFLLGHCLCEMPQAQRGPSLRREGNRLWRREQSLPCGQSLCWRRKSLLAAVRAQDVVREGEDGGSADRRPEANQGDAGHDPGDNGQGDGIDAGLDAKDDKASTEGAGYEGCTHCRGQADHDGGDEQQRRDDAYDADQQTGAKTGPDATVEGEQTEGGKAEHDEQNLDDEAN